MKLSRESKALPNTKIRMEWEYATNFDLSLFKAKRQVIQSPGQTNDWVWTKRVSTILCSLLDSP